MSQEPGDSPELPEEVSLKRFLRICDPALLFLLGEYIQRKINNGEKEPELGSIRLWISFELLSRGSGIVKPGEEWLFEITQEHNEEALEIGLYELSELIRFLSEGYWINNMREEE